MPVDDGDDDGSQLLLREMIVKFGEELSDDVSCLRIQGWFTISLIGVLFIYPSRSLINLFCFFCRIQILFEVIEVGVGRGGLCKTSMLILAYAN